MKLKKAIRVNNDILGYWNSVMETESKEAIRLGIEALKWRQLMEQDYGSWCGPLLPGETEEGERNETGRSYRN